MRYAFVSSTLLASGIETQTRSTGKMFAVTKVVLLGLNLSHTCHKILIGIGFGACSESQLHQHCPCESSPQTDGWGPPRFNSVVEQTKNDLHVRTTHHVETISLIDI